MGHTVSHDRPHEEVPMSTCPSCGAQVPEGSQFCPDCGTAITPPAPEQYTAPEPPPYSAPQAPPVAPPQYPQQYAPPSAGVQPVPKKRKKGLIIGIVIAVLVLLLGCCGAGAWLVLNSNGGAAGADKAKAEAIETFAVGLGTLDFDKLRSVTQADVHDELALIEEAFASDGENWDPSVLLSSEWDGETLLMSFEDPDGLVSYIRIYPPSDGGTSLYALDWDDTSSEEEAIRTEFEVIEDDGWKVYSVDGETLDVYLGF